MGSGKHDPETTIGGSGNAGDSSARDADPMTDAEPFGAVYEETVAGDERLRVQVLRARDGRFGFVAQCGYQACDGPFRDTYRSQEAFDDEEEAREAGKIKARQLAGIDVPEA